MNVVNAVWGKRILITYMIIDYAIPIHNIHILSPCSKSKNLKFVPSTYTKFGIKGAQNQAMV